ncbi:MAG: sulfatase-like hydrolase/transferase [Solirubrobacteraceae bacterium]|nr:sulfatase-like hydrolase/transferase [Solirubrobacteraceae bacterium]
MSSAPAVEAQQATKEWPSWWVLGLQLAALWSLGLVRPLFDVLGSDSAFFVARGNTPGDILIFAIGLTFIPPLILTLIEVIVRAVSASAARIVHVLFITLLIGLVAMQFIKGPFSATLPAFVISLAIGALAAVAFWKTTGMRTFLTVLTPASFLFLALFVFASPVSSVIMPSSEGSSGAAGESGNSTPVVLVIYDEFPAAMLMKGDTSIDAERFPNFAELGQTATWYKNNTTVSDATWSAVPAILTGFTPPDKTPNNAVYEQSIYTMLAPSHRVTNLEAVTHVCPSSICEPLPVGNAKERLTALFDDLTVVAGRTVLPDSLANQLPAIDATYTDFAPTNSQQSAAEVKTAADPKSRFADSPPLADLPGAGSRNEGLRLTAEKQNAISGEGRPPLYVFHMLLPHVPWRFSPEGDQYISDGSDAPGLNDQIWSDDRYPSDVALQRSMLQTEYSDKILGSFVKRMKEAGIWQRSLFIVTADHGVSYRPGGSRRPVTKQNLPELANTPLFVKLPGQSKGAVDTGFTQSIDIAPTVAQVTKTGDGLKFNGVPLGSENKKRVVAVRNGRAEKKITGDWNQMIEQRDELARSWSELFPPGRASLYRLGPNQNLIGRQVSSLQVGSTAATAKILSSELYKPQTRDDGVLQIYLAGSIDGAPAQTPLAAAVNGKIVAVGQTFDTVSGVRFAIILPPESLKGSKVRVQLFSVSGGTTLAQLAAAGR